MESIIRVAVADDHYITRKGVMDIIRAFGGFSIDIEASNGKELFNKLSEADTLPDIVVMDISMPVWDGYETLDAIRKKWPELKVMILTMHKHEFAIIKMFRGGANGYLLKNTRPEEIHKALQSICDTGIYFSEVASSNLYHRLQGSNVIPLLTEREIQLLKLCPLELTYEEIADKMGVSEPTIAGYRNRLFEKLSVNSRVGLAVCAIQMGLVPTE